ncbi:hypothetical protein YQE_06084, partial [Dendroctonus ponderosae]
MGRKCSVENCSSDSTKSEHIGVTFHKVPHHTDVRPKWLSLCRISEHRSKSKLLFKGRKYMLKQGVLPSVFPWDKSRLEAIKAEVSVSKDGEPTKKRARAGRKKEAKPKQVCATESGPGEENLEQDIKKECEDPDEAAPEADLATNVTGDIVSSMESDEPQEEEFKAEPLDKDEINESTNLFDEHQSSQSTSQQDSPSIDFSINSSIEVLDNNNIWHVAKINEVDYEENEVLIHFENSVNKCDEWISMSSPRLRPIYVEPQQIFDVGERCMAIWSVSKKFPASISKKLDNDFYELLFDDGYVKVVNASKMSKISLAKPAQSSPLFDPIKSTKQERRDKKRKINVAALFAKRIRLNNTEEKKSKGSPAPAAPVEEANKSPASQDEAPNTNQALSVDNWHPRWENGKPVGIESTIESVDGLRKSTIVADPRMPPGWTKHLTQRMYGNSIGKWDTVILAPDGKKFRTKQEIKNYLELHPGIDVNVELFDFSLYRGKRKGKPKAKVPVESVALPKEEPPAPVEETKPAKAEASLDSPTCLKIIFENEAFKCPIEGCGKNFRRENLALMHVKHYHPEYTKYLESTPNVADLAYARTVGENLDRSPGPAKAAALKTADKTATPKVAKASAGAHLEAAAGGSFAPDVKVRDTEIIKLLTQKPIEGGGENHHLPSGLPSNMYPDIKLKDLLGKSDDLAMRDDIHLKNLCSSRPSQGSIKTLLPVRHSNALQSDLTESKRKKGINQEQLDVSRGKTPHHSASTLDSPHLSHHPPLPHQSQQATPISLGRSSGAIDGNPFPSAFDLAPPPAELESSLAPTVTQFDGVIIEGGKIIKLERMKQEEIINCTCGFIEEDGLMIQCELCLCWQHAYCNNIQKESEVPEKYVCYICQHPLRERQSAKYVHDQDWLKQGVLPVTSFHSKDKLEMESRFAKLKKCHDVSGGLLELREYMHALATKLKIAEVKNHPKLYLWSKPWDKPKLQEKPDSKEQNGDRKASLDSPEHQYVKNEIELTKEESPNHNMLMMILKGSKEEIPMLNINSNSAPIIPRPKAAIDSADCRLNLLEHISDAESLVDERLDYFEKQLDDLEQGLSIEVEEKYPKTRQTLQLLMKDLDTLKQFSELPMN